MMFLIFSLMTSVVVMVDGGVDLSSEIARQKVISQQVAVL